MHQAIAFAIAGEFCRKRPFARKKFRSEDEIFAISFAKPFAFASGFLRNAQFAAFCSRSGGQKFASEFQKNPRVRKIRVRNSGAGNGCANFMDTWKNAFFLQAKTMSVKFPFFGGGFCGGGECRFYFYGRVDFASEFSERVRIRIRIRSCIAATAVHSEWDLLVPDAVS